MAGIEIREAVEADAEALHSFMSRLVEERLEVLYLRTAPPTVDEERAFVRQLRASPNSILLVATCGAEIVGVLDFHGDKRPQAAHTGQLGMSVASPYRGQGVGKALLDAVIAWAPSAGITRLELQVFENNPAAIHLYEQRGFRHEGRRRACIDVGSVKIDALLMALLVDERRET